MSDLDRIPDWMAPDTTTARLDLKIWAQEFRDVYQVAEALCKTSFVPKEMIGKQNEVTACIMKGRELGLDPFDALGSMYIVHGRVGMYAEFMRRRIIQAGHTFRIIESTENRCIVEGIRSEGGDPHRASFTTEQARKAGIDLGRYPAEKLIARATSRLCKQAFPDVLAGSLIIEDIVDGVIPALPDQGDEPPTPSAIGAPVQRTRKTRAAKAAATQPKPATPPAAAEPDVTEIAELLGDDDAALEKAVAEAEALESRETAAELADTEDDWAPRPPGPGQIPLLDDDPLQAQPGTIGTPPYLVDEHEIRLITPQQLKKLSILLREAGFDDRDSRHGFVAAAIGHDITSAKDLTLDEASRVIDILENNSTPTDDEET